MCYIAKLYFERIIIIYQFCNSIKRETTSVGPVSLVEPLFRPVRQPVADPEV